MDQEHKQTHFGFKQVASEKKQGLVNQVFSSVANKYDLMNDLMSFGIHHIWKSRFVDYIKNLNSNILDVAGGTGDISFKIIEKARKIGAEPQITIADINVEMLEIGKDKAIDKNILSNIKFVEANAEDLPFDDNSFDYYTVAFGIRNMTNLNKVISEAYRVLKPGGKFLCLEFSQVKPIFLRKIYDLYSFNVIPQIGHFVAGDKDSYEYLVESIRKFPRQEKFAELINAAGFKNVKYENLTFGVCAIHSAEKI